MNPTAKHSSSPRIDAATLKTWLHDDAEIALLDVREHGQYGEAHIFYAIPAPYSRLEEDITRLAPRRDVRIVVYDNDDGVAERALGALNALGYSGVHVLQGGIATWTAAGHNVFAGVNVPSKTFGELAEIEFHTPRIGPRDLAARLAQGDDLVVLDGRPFTEFGKMSIPGAICCPNGELALHALSLAPDPATTIVINCAGRTRSIIGAQTLINLGVPNTVLALENGTQGWYLEDLTLEHGASRRHASTVAPEGLAPLREHAAALARRAGVPTIDAACANAWLADPSRSTYLCDVRTPEEFDKGSLPGAQHTPGGQLIQATDQYVAVRRGRLILADDDAVRAPVVASWLAQMGWEVAVLQDGVKAAIHPVVHDARQALRDTDESNATAQAVAGETSAQNTPVPNAAAPKTIDADTLYVLANAGALLIDVRPSQSYRSIHIEQARWSVRPRLAALAVPATAKVVLLAHDIALARLAAAELCTCGVTDIAINIDSPEVWKRAGLTLVSTPDFPPDHECIDFLFFVHDRHDGNKQAARQYLAWETNLIHQIDPEERATFDFTLPVLSHDSQSRQ